MPDVRGAVGSATIQALLNEVDLNGDGEVTVACYMVICASQMFPAVGRLGKFDQ